MERYVVVSPRFLFSTMNVASLSHPHPSHPLEDKTPRNHASCRLIDFVEAAHSHSFSKDSLNHPVGPTACSPQGSRRNGFMSVE